MAKAMPDFFYYDNNVEESIFVHQKLSLTYLESGSKVIHIK